MWAKQSTAATLIVGPILDSTGAEYTSAVIGDLSISKNGGTLTALASAATLTHIANGQYTLVMTTGNLDTLGRLQITCNKSTYQMPPIGLNIVPAMVFDSLVLGTDRFDANVTHVTDTAQTAGDIYALQVAIAGYIDTEVAAIKAKTDNLPSDPADASDIAASFATVNGTLGTIAGYIDTEVGAIKAKTDQLTFTTANKVDSTAVLDSARDQTLADLANMITGSGTVDAKFDATALSNAPSGTGGDATLAKQVEILTAIQGSQVIQVASPNVSGNLVLTQGDDYDGTANPKASWTVSTDYTDGWAVTLTIRDVDDAVIYTTAGTVVSSTVVAVTIAAPTGLTMTGCPGQWQGKFDVQLTKAGKKKTIALGVCYINEDQTR